MLLAPNEIRRRDRLRLIAAFSVLVAVTLVAVECYFHYSQPSAEELDAQAVKHDETADECERRAAFFKSEIPILQRQEKDAIARGASGRPYAYYVACLQSDVRAQLRYVKEFRGKARQCREEAAERKLQRGSCRAES